MANYGLLMIIVFIFFAIVVLAFYFAVPKLDIINDSLNETNETSDIATNVTSNITTNETNETDASVTDICYNMTEQEALEIANSTKICRMCGFDGVNFCNNNTGTWWLELNYSSDNSSCDPVCVVDITNRSLLEINYRCTGLELPS